MTKKLGSIRDVAKETGLSIATISRVMNGATNVSPDTREKVLLASKKLHYVPNPAARTLTTKKTKIIAAVIPTIEHSVYAKFIAGMEQTLAKRGYSLVFAISNSDEEQEKEAAEKLLGMGAEAFVLSGGRHDPELIELLTRRGVQFVFTSIWAPKSDIPTIGYDNFALARGAIEYLHKMGHQNIAVIHGPEVLSDRTTWRKKGAQSAEGPDINLAFFEEELSVGGGKLAAYSMLEHKTKFTAALCLSDVMALGVYTAHSEKNLVVPDDLSVMGFDNLDWSVHISPPLTTIDLPARKMGESAVTSLMNYLEDGSPITRKFFEAKIIERASVKKL